MAEGPVDAMTPVGANNPNGINRIPDQSSEENISAQERAQAIAEVSILPSNNGNNVSRRGGGREGNAAMEEALLEGDFGEMDEAGMQVRSLFLDFLYGL